VDRPGRVGNLPDDDGSDLDRVAVGIVDLEAIGLEVAHPDTHGAADRQWTHTPEPWPTNGAHIGTKELYNTALARRDDHDRTRNQTKCDDKQADHPASRLRLNGSIGRSRQPKQCGHSQPASNHGCLPLLNLYSRSLAAYRLGH